MLIHHQEDEYEKKRVPLTCFFYWHLEKLLPQTNLPFDNIL